MRVNHSYSEMFGEVKLSRFGVGAFFFLVCSIAGQGWADQTFVTQVRNSIVELGWDSGIAAELASAQEVSLAIHEANGTLGRRLDPLGRYNNNGQMQELIVRHPAYLDFFLNLREPNEFVEALDAFSLRQEPREALLEALLINPGLNGQRQFEHAVKTWGVVLGPLADRPEFGTLVQELVWVGREGGTADFEAWVYDLLDGMEAREIEAVTVLLAHHANFLRREIDIAERWEIVERYVEYNPDLGVVLLEHLGIWDQLPDDRLLKVINEQSAYYGPERAVATLIFLLGYSQSLNDVSVPISWRKPLRKEYANWALGELKRDPTSPAIEGAFHFRNDDSYWRFVMREGIVERLPCLLAQQGEAIEGLSKYFGHTAKQVDDECLGGDWVTGGSLYRLGSKIVHGTPIDSEDVVWASLDVLDAGISILSMGTAKLAVPAMKGSILALKVGRLTTMGPAPRAMRQKLASSVKSDIISANIDRRAVSTKAPGLSRLLGVSPYSMVRGILAKPNQLPPFHKKILEEMVADTALSVGGEILENSFTTEFIRCAGIETLAARDPVCMTLFSSYSDPTPQGDDL